MPLDEETRDELVGRLEAVANGEVEGSASAFDREPAALRLADYYRRHDRLDDARRVLRTYGEAYVELAKEAKALVGQAWLKKVHAVYRDYGMTEDAEKVAVIVRDLGAKARDELVPIRAQAEIPTEEIEKLIDRLLEGELEDALSRVCTYFTPDSDEAERLVKELAESAPLMSMIGLSVMNHEGRTVAEVGSVEDDLASRVVLQLHQNMQLEGPILRRALGELCKRFELDAERLADQLEKSPVFEPSRRGFLLRGIRAFLEEDHLCAVHVLVPQVEAALRHLLELLGRPVLARGRGGQMRLLLLGEVLRDDALERILRTGTVAYLKVLLSDERGWNLRNAVCHGMLPADAVGPAESDRVVHALLLLGALRRDEGAPESDPLP